MNSHDEAEQSAPEKTSSVKLSRWHRMTPEQRRKHAEGVARWKIANTERFKQTTDAYVLKNKDTIQAQKNAWTRKNKGKMDALKSAWNAANPDRVKAMAQRTIAAGHGPCPAYLRKWRQKNPAKTSEYNQRKYNKDITKSRASGRIHTQNRRGRMAGGKLSLDLAAHLLVSQNNTCVYCPADLRVTGYHLDHVIALSKGGRHDDANIALACPRCNLSKHARDPEEFRRYRCTAA